ncbi:MAG: hypothetical protein H9535_03345 [Ignavibacteria bacterium]|nr:hypothetical protein [Ignavibacteria bacterium]
MRFLSFPHLVLFPFVVVFLLSTSSLFGQTSPAFLQLDDALSDGKDIECSRLLATKANNAQLTALNPLAPVRRPYDILKYSLFMDWTNPLSSTGEVGDHRVFFGSNTIILRIDSSDVQSIVLNAVQMAIDSVLVNSVKYDRTITVNAETQDFSIPLAKTPKQGDTMTLVVYYRITSMQNSTNLFAPSGFYLYRKYRSIYTSTRPSGAPDEYIPERLAYTMSEPINARSWMPCNDGQYDKALMDITVRVPEDYSVASNGKLNEIRRDPQTKTATFYWKHEYPIAPYLASVSASVFRQFSEKIPRVSLPLDSLEIMYYVWEQDYRATIGDGRYNARKAFSLNSEILSTYSRLFGEYPFEKYGVVALQPFAAGGMEHQTITALTRTTLKVADLQYYGNDSLFFLYQYNVHAHEAAHHWFGDKVTCATWYDIWLNEGSARYAEALWLESKLGKRGYSARLNLVKTAALSATRPIYSTSITNPADVFTSAIAYSKPAWVHHMLRRMLGDDNYFKAIRTYLDRFAYQTATTEDFIKVFKDVIPNPPVPFDTFFKQWIYQTGYPVYNISWDLRPSSNGYAGNVSLVQSQTAMNGSDVPNVFAMPVTLTFVSTDGKRETRRIINTQRTQTETIIIPFAPVRVLVDEDEDILRVVNNQATAAHAPETTTRLALAAYPQPTQVGSPMTIRVDVPRLESVRVVVFDTLGKTVESVHDGFLPQGTYYFDLHTNIPQGNYIVQVTSGTERQAQLISIVR